MMNRIRAAIKVLKFDKTIELVTLNLKKMSSMGIMSPPPPIPVAFARVMVKKRTKKPKNS